MAISGYFAMNPAIISLVVGEVMVGVSNTTGPVHQGLKFFVEVVIVSRFLSASGNANWLCRINQVQKPAPVAVVSPLVIVERYFLQS